MGMFSALLLGLFIVSIGLGLNAVVFPNTELLAELNEHAATGNVWDGAKLHLYKTQLALSPTMVIGDFTAAECDFTGYAASATLVWGTAFINPSGIPTIDAASVNFVGGSPFTVANTVYGWYLTDGAGTTLIAARQFDQPINVSAAGVGFSVLPAIPAYLTQ